MADPLISWVVTLVVIVALGALVVTMAHLVVVLIGLFGSIDRRLERVRRREEDEDQGGPRFE